MPGLLRPGFAVDHIEYRGCVSRLLSRFTCGVCAASLGGVSPFDAVQVAYQKFLSHLMRHIATAHPVTAGTRFQGTIGQVDIERAVAVSTEARKLAYSVEFVLKTRNPLQFLSAFLLKLEDFKQPGFLLVS